MITVLRNSRGFTLIEFLAAIVILMVGLLGLLQTVNYAYVHNRQTQIRNEAVQVADSYMVKEMVKGFSNVSVSTRTFSVNDDPYDILNSLKGFRNFSVTRGGNELTNSKQVNYEVRWRYKGTSYTHGVSSFVSKANQ